jgi:FMN phosphatase YigB (HAD superfamily)
LILELRTTPEPAEQFMIRAIIFDLDSCLSAADEPGQQLYAPAFDAITRASQGSHNPAVLQKAFADMWRLPFDFVADVYAFTPAMKSAGWECLRSLEVTEPMKGYGDLDALADLPTLRFLVTSGFRRLQESKIRALRIAPTFTAIHVDAIDQSGYRGKQAIFDDILRDHRLEPAHVLIVGDNHDSEIAIGVRLGIRTVQTLRPNVPFSPAATHHIQTLHELKPLLRLT